MNIRQMIDTTTALQNGGEKQKTAFKPGDQVIVKKKLGFGRQQSSEVMVGTIAAFGQGGTAIVSIPRPSGAQLRSTVPLGLLQPVSEVYKRNRVHINSAFRGSSV